MKKLYLKERIIDHIPLLVRHLWGQIQLFGKSLPKKGLCQHFTNTQMFIYLGDSPIEYCRVHNRHYYFNFIVKEWIEAEDER